MRTVSDAAHTDAHFIIPTEERFITDLDALVWHQDEPFTSTSIFAQWCVMAKVREVGVTVLLDGQGADEALAGYRPFDRHVGDMIGRGAVISAARELMAVNRVSGGSTAMLAARAIARQLPSVSRAWTRRNRGASNRAWLAPQFAEVSQARQFPDDVSLDDHLRTLISEYSLPHLLRYEDRNSMAFSIEARVPFLDYRLVEYSFAHASRQRIRNGWTKWVLRQAMNGVVPDEIIWRRDKVGFDTPEGRWMASVVPAMRARFEDARSARFLDVGKVRQALSTWPNAQVDSRRAWRWINLESWLRCWT